MARNNICTLFVSTPIFLEIAEPPPIPTPFAIAITIKRNGKMYPTADRASGPLPETHIASVRLYIVCADIAATIGIESLMIAFLGSPSSVLTPSVFFEMALLLVIQLH